MKINMRRIELRAVAGILFLGFLGVVAGAQGSKNPGKWVSAWSAAVHTPLPFPGLPPSPVFENQTIRMVIRPTLGGQRLRIRISNAYGSSALEIGSAHVALLAHGSSIVPESDHAVTFDGQPSVRVPVGAPILSDPVDMEVPAFAEVFVSFYLPHVTPATTTHFWAQHETYVSGPGDFSAKVDIPRPTTTLSWYWLSDIEVWTAERASAVLTLGDSITDGVGAKQGTYSDWPDLLARRLDAKGGVSSLAVLNEGIGGNRILYDGAGINALARFDRDVLAQPGVSDLIVLEGINDIGWPHMKPRSSKDGTQHKEGPFAAQSVTADDLIAGLRQIVDRAHEHHIRVFGATLTPYEGADYFSQDGEAVRQAVNRWIRMSGAFDGVIDFDAAVRDPAHPSQFREDYQSGDHLHPSAAGYKSMADAIDLAPLQGTVP
jgi:lysophospholipase L1-like esterase